MLAKPEHCQLLIVDVQDKLAPHVHEGDAVVAQCANLIGAAQLLGVPVLVSEHYPEGIGHTVATLRDLIPPTAVMRKDHFSCLSELECRERLRVPGRPWLVIAGMEAHVCVMQTALEAHEGGLNVLVVADAVGSRRASDRSLALERMRAAGVTLVSREMIIFEWAGRGATDTFRALHRRFLR